MPLSMATAKRGTGIRELLTMHDKARSLACSDFLDKTLDVSDGHAVAACYGKSCCHHSTPTPLAFIEKDHVQHSASLTVIMDHLRDKVQG